MSRLLSCLSIPAIILVSLALVLAFLEFVPNSNGTKTPDISPTQDAGTTVTPDFRDRDGDALADHWEEQGLDINDDGLVDVNLVTLGADPDVKDVFVELDYMSGFAPSPEAIQRIEEVFSAAGISLHMFVDDEVPHEDEVDLDHAPDDDEFTSFDRIKLGTRGSPCDGYFGTEADRQHADCAAVLDARKQVFRYGLLADELAPRDGRTGGTGRAEVGGNDFLVTLGGLDSNDAGNFVFEIRITDGESVLEERTLFSVVDGQAGTLMHELGHSLGLWHGGGDEANCKPNYLSVMSYARQFPFLPSDWLDYSSQRLPALDEDELDEPAGIGRVAEQYTVYGFDSRAASSITDEWIDWDRDSMQGGGVSGNLNYIKSIGCDGDNDNDAGQVLDGYDDWDELDFDFRDSPDFADGIHTSTLTVDEITVEQIVAYASELDVDTDGPPHLFDNCPFDANADQSDRDDDGVGDLCDLEPGPEDTGDQPVVDAGLSHDDVDEGSSVLIDATVSDPDGDGLEFTWSSDSPSNLQFNDPTLEDPTVTFLNDGEYTLTLATVDSTGMSASDTTTVTVNNVAPLLDRVEGISIATTTLDEFVSFYDSGNDSWTISVNYGDETATEAPAYGSDPDRAAGFYLFPLEHTYEDDGTYPITVTVSDGTDADQWTFDVVIDLPDLFIEDYGVDGGTQDPAITFAIGNQGDGDAGPFTVVVECLGLNDETPTAGFQVPSTPVPTSMSFEFDGLAADSEVEGRSDPSTSGCFSFNFTITVDFRDAVDETNEENNTELYPQVD